MMKRTLMARTIDVAKGSILVAATSFAMTVTAAAQAGDDARHDLCIIGSVSVPQACPWTINRALASKDGFMAIHMDNQKKDSAVAALWRALTLDETVVGSVSAQNRAP